jgi:hypothetical protein
MPNAGALNFPEETPVPGKHIIDQQARIYMNLRRTHTREAAAARAALSATTGARLDADSRLPSQKQIPRGRRRADPLAAIWDREVLPMLEALPGLRPVSILAEPQRRRSDVPAGTRRTLKRRARTWQALHGWQRDVIFRQEHPPGPAGSVRLWQDIAARADQEGWPAVRFLWALAEFEIAARAKRRIERHLAESRLPPGKTIDRFDFAAVPMISKAHVPALASGTPGWARAPTCYCSGHPVVARATPRQRSAAH